MCASTRLCVSIVGARCVVSCVVTSNDFVLTASRMHPKNKYNVLVFSTDFCFFGRTRIARERLGDGQPELYENGVRLVESTDDCGAFLRVYAGSVPNSTGVSGVNNVFLRYRFVLLKAEPTPPFDRPKCRHFGSHGYG